ncbi:MAG: hypothetical protein Q8934_22525 [Bacillota bacterium]|nr:hypothetical protein [Bacillota bacterium]
MSGKKSRDKGARREREFSKLIDGVKTPLSGAVEGFPNDVHGLGLEWEVKARKDGFKTLYDWVLDEREKPDALALKVDRKPWLVVMTLDKFMEVLNDGEIPKDSI